MVRGCDQCYWDVRRCSKELPTCLNCLKANKKCTRNKISKYRATINKNKAQHSPPNDGILNLDKKTINSEAVIADTRNKFKIVDHVRFKKIDSIRLTYSLYQNQNGWISFLRRCLLDPTSRYKLNYFSRVLSISLQKSSESQRLTISKLFNEMTLLSCSSRVRLHLQHQIQDIEDILTKATESYFINDNILFPVFPDNAFHRKPRSHFLKVSICRVGLQYLPKSVLKSDIIDYLDKLILSYIKPSKLKPSLDHLQSILVIIFGCHSSPLIGYRSRLFSIAVSWVPLLGLESITSKLRFTESQMTLGLIYGFDFYFSNVVNSIFLPPISLPSIWNHKINFISLYLQRWSIIINDAYLHISTPEECTMPEYIFYLLKRLDMLIEDIRLIMNKVQPKNAELILYYIDLIYHYHYVKLLDLMFDLKPATLEKLDKYQLSLLKQTGYVHSLLIIQKTIPLQNFAFECSRIPFLLQASKILNSWAAPCPPCIYSIVERNIMRTHDDSLQGQTDFALKLIDHYFKV